MGKQKQKIYNPDPKNRIKSNNWQFWAIIALPVIYAVVFAYIPMAGILIAFEDYSKSASELYAMLPNEDTRELTVAESAFSSSSLPFIHSIFIVFF